MWSKYISHVFSWHVWLSKRRFTRVWQQRIWPRVLLPSDFKWVNKKNNNNKRLKLFAFPVFRFISDKSPFHRQKRTSSQRKESPDWNDHGGDLLKSAESTAATCMTIQRKTNMVSPQMLSYSVSVGMHLNTELFYRFYFAFHLHLY